MNRRGFTMVELLGVIAVIAILAAILFPVFARARAQAQAHSCRINLLNIGMALRLYAADNDGWYPPKEDDLSPLFPDYLTNEQVFACPVASWRQQVPMGAPADPSIKIEDRGSSWGPYYRPPAHDAPPPPPSGPPPSPGPPPPEEERPAEQALFTTYYYRAGRRHNELPRAPLVSDHCAHHSERANVLFSDGAIDRVPEAAWRERGFQPIDEILQERQPQPPAHPRLPPGMGPPCPPGPPGGRP